MSATTAGLIFIVPAAIFWFWLGYCFGQQGERRAMERRGQCAHVWDLWKDITRPSAYQQRTCLVCNLTEGRYV